MNAKSAFLLERKCFNFTGIYNEKKDFYCDTTTREHNNKKTCLQRKELTKETTSNLSIISIQFINSL